MISGQLARFLGSIRQKHPVPARVILWDGSEHSLGEDPRVAIKVRDAKALRYLLPPTLERLGEAYVEGAIDAEGSIRDVIHVASQLAEAGTSSRLGALPTWARRHTRQSDRDAIHYHYDVSNDFYRLFLDDQLVYSCAYFEHPSISLEAAQVAKLDLICRKLRLSAGMRLLDIGCGWGALALHAARHYGCKVVGITLSDRQFELASQRAAEAGLANQVEIRRQDYRDVGEAGHYDRISSVGMFEHVGLKQLHEYFSCVHRLLKPGGIALNHGITSADPDSRSVGLGGGEFIGRYVFPDGELPHVSLAISELSRAGLELLDAESLRRHYGFTLWAWSERLEHRIDEARAIAGEMRTRIWRAYLAGCAHAFDAGWINIYQLLVARPQHTEGRDEIDQPMTRDYMYRPV
ncbi:MAG: cyclopropane-fatty-acyl-phospholipid synthase family protein [Burkholderiaceae bacterium]